LVSFHDCISQFADGIHDELGEGSLQRLSSFGDVFGGPEFVFGIIESVTPELFLEFLGFDLELRSIDSGHPGEGEGPALLA